MTGKVEEVVIERRSEDERDFEEVYTFKAEEPKEFMGSKWYDENIAPGERYRYRIYSKLGERRSPESREYEFEVPQPDKWYYPADNVSIIPFSEMPVVHVLPAQAGFFAEKIITARLLPEYLTGPDVVYVKYVSKGSPEYARYGIYKIDPGDRTGKYDVLWKDFMAEDEGFEIEWAYTGRFFLCDVTGDGITELGLVLISAHLNIQRVYFFRVDGEFACIFKNKFNINDYKDEGDFKYVIESPGIITYGSRRDCNANRPGKFWFEPYIEYRKVYEYSPDVNRFLLIDAEEHYKEINN